MTQARTEDEAITVRQLLVHAGHAFLMSGMLLTMFLVCHSLLDGLIWLFFRNNPLPVAAVASCWILGGFFRRVYVRNSFITAAALCSFWLSLSSYESLSPLILLPGFLAGYYISPTLLGRGTASCKASDRSAEPQLNSETDTALE